MPWTVVARVPAAITQSKQSNANTKCLRGRRYSLSREPHGQELTPQANAIRAEIVKMVNNFFLGEVDRYTENLRLHRYP
jgi:hypothetical protein